jgi:hypothetical protein
MNASMLLKISSDHIRGINQKEQGPLVTYVLGVWASSNCEVFMSKEKKRMKVTKASCFAQNVQTISSKFSTTPLHKNFPRQHPRMSKLAHIC